MAWSPSLTVLSVEETEEKTFGQAPFLWQKQSCGEIPKVQWYKVLKTDLKDSTS